MIDDEVVLNWFSQLCMSIQYIHNHKILHRDLKAANIFLTDEGERIMIGDFGISKIMHHTLDFAETLKGTPLYLPPEICSGHKYDFKADMWNLGCVLYEMCTLKKPFDGESIPMVMNKIINQTVIPPPKDTNPVFVKLIDMLLEKNPNLRASIDEILQVPEVDEEVEKIRNLPMYQSHDKSPQRVREVKYKL